MADMAFGLAGVMPLQGLPNNSANPLNQVHEASRRCESFLRQRGAAGNPFDLHRGSRPVHRGYLELFQQQIGADTVVANVLVTTPRWRIPDYLSESGYKVRSLAETEAFVSMHKQLPDLPGAAEMVKPGTSLGEINLRLLKTVEESILHMIKMDE